MKSKIYERDIVHNSERTFGSAQSYVVAEFVKDNGEREPLLLTDDQLDVARERAKRNKEDIPKPAWIVRVWRWLAG